LINAIHFRTYGSFGVARQSKIGLKTVDFFDSFHARCKKLSIATAPQQSWLVTTFVAE
jgi:hypothetical protein